MVNKGKDKGKVGKLVAINRKTSRVKVEGVNMLKKTVKPTQENPNGGIFDKEGFIHISNINIVSPKDGKKTKIKIVKQDGKNIRVSRSCGSKLD